MEAEGSADWPMAGGAGSGLTAGAAFVGRSKELSLLTTLLAQVVAGRARFVLVRGPAGIGKTSLVQHFRQSVKGLRLIEASGDETEMHLPFGVVDQLFCSVVNHQRKITRRTPLPADPLTAGTDLLDLLRILQREGPLAVVLDDGQWADTPSLQALTFVVRRLHADRILVLVIVRDDSVITEGLRRALGGERGYTLLLGGLGVEELSELAVHRGFENLPHRVVKRLFEHTDGNPLHALALLEQLPPDVLNSVHSELPAPRSFGVLVVSRLASCSPAAQELVLAVAVLGRRGALGLAASIAELADPTRALDDAVRAGLLVEEWDPGGCTLSFPHPLVRAAVYGNLGPARRSDLHTRAAAVLDRGVAALDHRVRASLVSDPILAADLEAFADKEVAAGVVASAAAHLLEAARLSTSLADRDRRLLDGAALLALNGDAALATSLAHEVAALPESPRQCLVLGRLAALAGGHSRARTLLIKAWDALDRDAKSDLAAQVAAQLAESCIVQGRGRETVVWARRALEATPEETFVSVPIYSRLMVGLTLSGESGKALALPASVVPAATEKRTPQAVDALLGRGLVRLWTDDLCGARADLAAVVDATHSWRRLREEVIALRFLAEAEYRLGAWDDSVIHAELAASIAEDSDQAWLLPFVYAMPVYPLAACGQRDEAACYARAASQATEALDESESAGTAYAATAAAYLAFTVGDSAAVADAVQPILRLRNRDFADEPGLMMWPELYVDALIDLGCLDEADSVLTRHEALACARERHSSLASLARARANLQIAQGQTHQAHTSFDEALRHVKHVSAPFDQARVQNAYGRFLRRAGQRRAAAAQLQGAGEIFAWLGACSFAEQTERELSACGLAPALRMQPDAARLTPQELATARLAAAGATNRQVAAELVVSIKTVEYHLGRVYTKLGISSRNQLADRLPDAADPSRHTLGSAPPITGVLPGAKRPLSS